MISTQPPSGFRDFINEDARLRLQLIEIISKVYQSFGFNPVVTPTLENLEVLVGSGGGEENEKLIFKVMKRGEKLSQALTSQDESQIADFGMRFDLTVPLSRISAQYQGQIQFPWKVFHIGNVYRAERAQKGRFREFTQCDVDIVGAKGLGAEAEVIQAVSRAVAAAGASGFSLKINHRMLLQNTAEAFGFTGEKADQFAVVLDKLDKIGAEEVGAQLETLLGQKIPEDLSALLRGDFDLKAAEKISPNAAAELGQLINTLKQLNLPLASIEFDATLARGLSYYTGCVFELRHPTAGYSLGGGGRYDKLIGRFSKREFPACGFSIGFDRLLLLLAESSSRKSAAESTIFFPVMNENLRAQISKIAQSLRGGGHLCDVYPDDSKLKAQLKYASDRGYRNVVIAGETELADGQVQVKDFQTQMETKVALSELSTYFKSLGAK